MEGSLLFYYGRKLFVRRLDVSLQLSVVPKDESPPNSLHRCEAPRSSKPDAAHTQEVACVTRLPKDCLVQQSQPAAPSVVASTS